jgi:hypothetical protein
LKTRTDNDGAPPGDIHGFTGFIGPIPLTNYHAYRVINPTTDATKLDLTLTIPRAPSRHVQFVGPDDKPISGVTIQGLVAQPMRVILEGSEADVLGLEPGEPREIVASSSDKKYVVRNFISTDDPQPVKMKLSATERPN